MTNPINYQNQPMPAYSGVTINITNPTLNAAPLHAPHQAGCTNPCCNHNLAPTFSVQQAQSQAQPQIQAQSIMQNQAQNVNPNTAQNIIPQPIIEIQPQTNPNLISNTNPNTQNALNNSNQQSYPPNYYLNNYNYINNGEHKISSPNKANQGFPINNNHIPNNFSNVQEESSVDNLETSKDIIQNLDDRIAQQKELEKNGKKTKVIALTNEYIMSLENYLNNPNSEIRLMAAKEVLTRLDEDKDRFDDAALNALLNKMLQDPNKLVRIAALSAFSSQLASGNDYTVQLLNNIKNNPNADKEDVLQVADIMLKMSSTTETRYVPIKQKQENTVNNNEFEILKQQNEQLRSQLQQHKEKEIARILQSQQGV